MNKQPALKIRRNQIKPGETLCDYCSAKCCRYFALPVETPETAGELDNIRWYLLHGFASVFIDEETWYVLVHTVCKHLGDDNRCGIYETRPQICRDYTTDDCEFEDDHTYDGYFAIPEQIEDYSQARFCEPDHPNFRTPRPSLPVNY